MSLGEAVAWALVRAARPGVARIEAAGATIEVDAAGRWTSAGAPSDAAPSDAARQLLDLYLPLQMRADFVIGQLGQSLDGRIATASGHSHYVTGPADIVRLHRLRALVDAVIVGAGTIAADDPRLTVREVEGDNPVRVILDPDDRLDPARNVFADGMARTIVVRRAGEEGPDRIVLPAGPRGFDPRAVVAALGARGLRRLLVEGGGITVSRFLEAGVLDRLHVCVAPMLIGSGRPALILPEIESLAQALRPRSRTFHLGDDVLFDLDLR